MLGDRGYATELPACLARTEDCEGLPGGLSETHADDILRDAASLYDTKLTPPSLRAYPAERVLSVPDLAAPDDPGGTDCEL